MSEKMLTASPERMGLPSGAIIQFLAQLERKEIDMRSFLLSVDGKLIAETYYAPLQAEDLQRMYSVTKSFTSLAIGLLVGRGDLRLDDRVADYFPDKIGPDAPAATLRLTVRDLLRMRTTHNLSSYKQVQHDDWVRSFFEVPPLKLPGAIYSYDTSASHLLSALVLRLTGKSLFTFLKGNLLALIGFSDRTYCLKAPDGIETGGSGLMARPKDLLKLMHLLMDGGRLGDRQLLPRDYLAGALIKQTDTRIVQGGSMAEFRHGYGYHFWRLSREGFACYGMGGQLAVCLPEQRLCFVTTADTQGRDDGIQAIFDAFYAQILERLEGHPLDENLETQAELDAFLASRKLLCVAGEHDSPLAAGFGRREYRLEDNDMGLKRLGIALEGRLGELLLQYEKGEALSLPFEIGDQALTRFPGTTLRCVSSAAWQGEEQLLIKLQVLDTISGNQQILCSFVEDGISLQFSQHMEEPVAGLHGFAVGRRAAEQR